MLLWLKKYIAVIHTGGQDVKLLQDGEHRISLNVASSYSFNDLYNITLFIL
jgi:hypothetical protein